MNWMQTSRGRQENDEAHQSHVFFQQQRKSKQLERIPQQQVPYLGHAHPSIPVAGPSVPRRDANQPVRGVSPVSSHGSSGSPYSIFSTRPRRVSVGPGVEEKAVVDGAGLTLSNRGLRFEPGRNSISPVSPHRQRLPSHTNHRDVMERERGRAPDTNRSFDRSPGPMVKFLRRESPNVVESRSHGPSQHTRKAEVLCPETPFFERQSQMQKRRDYDSFSDLMVPESPAISAATSFSPRRLTRDFDEDSVMGEDVDDASRVYPKEKKYDEKGYFDLHIPEPLPLPTPISLHLSQESVMSIDTYSRLVEEKEKNKKEEREISRGRSMNQRTKSQQEKASSGAGNQRGFASKSKQSPERREPNKNDEGEQLVSRKPPAKRPLAETSNTEEKAKKRKAPVAKKEEQRCEYSTQSLKKLDKFLPDVEDFIYVPRNTIKANEETLLQLLSTYVSSGAFLEERKGQFEKLGVEMGNYEPGTKFFLSEEEEDEFVRETVEAAAAAEIAAKKNEEKVEEEKEQLGEEGKEQPVEEEKEQPAEEEEQPQEEEKDEDIILDAKEQEEEEAKFVDAEIQTSFLEEDKPEEKKNVEFADADVQTNTQSQEKEATVDTGLQTDSEEKSHSPVVVTCGHQQELQKTNDLLGSMLLTQETMLLNQKSVVALLELLIKEKPSTIREPCCTHLEKKEEPEKKEEKGGDVIVVEEEETVGKEAHAEQEGAGIEKEVVPVNGEEVPVEETELAAERVDDIVEETQAVEKEEAEVQSLAVDGGLEEKETVVLDEPAAAIPEKKEDAVTEESKVPEEGEKENEPPEAAVVQEPARRLLLDRVPKLKRTTSLF